MAVLPDDPHLSVGDQALAEREHVVYSHVTPTMQREAAAALDALLGG